MKQIHKISIYLALPVLAFFLFPGQSFAACTVDKYEELLYPYVLNPVKDQYYDSEDKKWVFIHADYLVKGSDGKYKYVGNVLDPRPTGSPKNAGLVWIPKEACGKKVDLLITLHGWRSLSKPGVNIFLKDPGQKQFDKIIREALDKKEIEPIVVAAPMYDRGPNQTVWEKEHYDVNILIQEIKKKLSGLNIEFSRVSIIGHSNANCGGGLAATAKKLALPLYIYGAADGTCGNQETNDFFQKYNVVETVKSKKAILFHMRQNKSDTQAAAYLKQQGGGEDPEAKFKSTYKEMWKNNDGTIFSYALTGGGDHDHTHVPQYMLKELLPRFFTAKPYDPAKSAAPTPMAAGSEANTFGATGDTTKPLTNAEVQEKLRKPVPRIKIPGLTFSEPVAMEVTDINGEKQIFVKAPFLGEYIAAIFRYGIIFLSLLSVVLIIISGMQWILRGGGDDKSEILKRIEGSIIGLVVAVGSYVILYTLNPELVSFKSLNIPFLQPLPVRPDYDESEIDEGNGIIGLSRYVNGKELTASDKCLEKEFFAGRIGMLPEMGEVEMFGVQKIKMNKNTIPALEIVSNEVLEKAKTDPEVSGYLQYMKDFKAKKVPDLLGTKDGEGTFSTAISKIGYYRRGSEKGQPRTCLRCDMHAPGLAVDIMTRSNWDVRWGGTAKGAPATRTCGVYKKTLEKMKTGAYGPELQKDPYHMFDRLEKKIASCLNHFNNGTEPYTSLPDGIVSAFENNGFYWGGWGWGKLRSDSMHFEYLGKCAGSKGGNKGGPADAYKLQKDLMCCKVNATGQEATVSSEKECTEKQGTVISTGAC